MARKLISKRGSSYLVRRQVHGEDVRRRFRLRSDAQDFDRQLERRAGGLPPLPGPAPTLADAHRIHLEYLVERDSAPEGLRYAEGKWAVLLRVLGPAARLDQITGETVHRFLEFRRAEGVGPRTLRAELQLLHHGIRLAGLAPAFLVPSLRVPDNPRRVAWPDELARLWVEVHGPAKSALALCLLTGMRPSEALRLEQADVDRDQALIAVRHRKAEDVYHVALVPTLEACLPIEGPPVAGSEPLVHSALVRASKRAGVPIWSGPGLGRHAFASWCVRWGGFSEVQVAEALGHRTHGSATMHYIHSVAVEPVRRPMSLLVERLLLEALHRAGGDRAS